MDPKPRILVFCEGKNTEPQYIVAFRQWCRNSRVDVEIAKERGVPLTLVTLAKESKRRAESEARKAKDDNLSYDEVWCVFDVDEHPKRKEAQNLARAHGISLAVSNPCFELWLLLHFRENPGMQHRHDLQKMLAGFVPDYNKHVDFELFKEGYPAAAKRAKRLDEQASDDGEEGRNPSTGVYRLTQSIQQN
nr:RloB family protein [Corallococcus exiguus]